MKAIIGSRKTVAKDTVEVVLHVPGDGLRFEAGQYIKLYVPDLEDPEDSNERELSIVSSPDNPNDLAVAYRLGGSSFKQALSSRPIGSEVEVEGRFGKFVLPQGHDKTIVFIAGGVGITPCLSMIRWALSKEPTQKMVLLYANRTPEDALYLSELESLAVQNGNFSYKLVYGTIKPVIIEQVVVENRDALYYISGLPEMVSAVRAMVVTSKVPENMIRIEEFSGYGTKAAEHFSTIKQSLMTTPDGIEENLTLDSVLWALNKFVIVSTTDVDGNIRYVNDKFLEISKYSREELIGQNHRILKSGFHPQQMYDDMWRKYLTKGNVWTGDLKNQAKDGSLYWVHSIIAPIFDKNGKKTGYIGIRFPITERKEAEEKLLLTSDMLKQASKAWGMIDLKGRILDANQSFSDLFGYSIEELKKMSYTDFIVSKEPIELKREFEMLMSTKKAVDSEAVGIKKGGQHIDIAYSVNLYFKDNKPTYMYLFLTDISERKVHDQELEQMNQMMVGRELRMIELKDQIAKMNKPSTVQESNDEKS